MNTTGAHVSNHHGRYPHELERGRWAHLPESIAPTPVAASGAEAVRLRALGITVRECAYTAGART